MGLVEDPDEGYNGTARFDGFDVFSDNLVVSGVLVSGRVI